MTPKQEPPVLVSGDERLNATYAAAVRNLSETNTVGGIIRAGGGYPTPWTRDASINAWSAASLLTPDAARDTLLAVCEGGRVQQDDQWWDQIIWAIAAWHHVVVTGDEAFLAEAYQIATASLAALEDRFDERYGLYRGAAVMQDGISGYPLTEPGNQSSFVLDHPRTHPIMCLSTNAVYAEAHRAIGRMADALGSHSRPYEEKAVAISAAINRWLWREEAGLYGYFLDSEGRVDPHEEALGHALALLFGVADERRRERILANLHREPKGVVNVWPHLDGFDAARPGRHGAICWPMVMGVWARAAAGSPSFWPALDELLELFRGSSYELFEVYNATSGRPDGGWQVGRAWESEPDQTWSATAFLGAVHHGLFGMRFTPDGMRFEPSVPAELGELRLTGLRYRGTALDLTFSKGHVTATHTSA